MISRQSTVACPYCSAKDLFEPADPNCTTCKGTGSLSPVKTVDQKK